MRNRKTRSLLGKIIDKTPGKQIFGIYRFLPAWFILGAALEFSMINWTVGETNFYRTFKNRQVSNALEAEVFSSSKPNS